MECHRGSCSRPEPFSRSSPSQTQSRQTFSRESRSSRQRNCLYLGLRDFGVFGAVEVSVLVLMSAGSGYAGRGGLLCYLGASHCDPGPGHYARLARGQRPNPHCSLGPLAFLQLKHCHPLPSPPHCCCLFRQ